MRKPSDRWPSLPYTEWQATCETIHMYAQVAGKIRLCLAPPEPQWGHVALYVTARGLTTSPIPYDGRTFEIIFDFIGHSVVIAVSDGQTRSIALVPRSVAAFYQEVVDALRSLGIEVTFSTTPQEVPDPIPFERDTTHTSYDGAAVERFFQVLSRVDMVFKKHRAPYRKRHTPVQLFWGSFDLSYTRFSGRPANPPPKAGLIFRLAMDAEEITAGFWPGYSRFPEAAIFAYTYPKPDGIENAAIQPSAAFWSKDIGEFLLRYEDVRAADSPEEAILQFLRSTYEAGARAAGWDNG